MARIFTILAFVAALGVVIPVVNAISPYSTTYQQTPNTSLNASYIQGVAGCSGVNVAGSAGCNASVSGSGSSGGILGSISNTVFVFGNFFAALTFLAQMAIGVLVPGQYVFQWLYAIFGSYSDALLIAGVFQCLIWVAYAYDFFYIVSGRYIQPSLT